MNIEQQLELLQVTVPDGMSDAVLLGTGLADGYATFDSPIGEVVVAFNPDGVSMVDLPDRVAEHFADRFGRTMIQAEPPRGWSAKINKAIERGTPGTLPVDLRSVTEFQQLVLGQTAKIPKGQVRSYGWLAQRVGKPNATRAVGSTMARNPVPLIVPCHRVVRSDGHIGNYSLGGPERKTELLNHEGTDPEWLEALASRKVRFTGSDTTHIFCHPTCSHARRTMESHTVEFRSMADAVQSGYRACKVCEPA